MCKAKIAAFLHFSWRHTLRLLDVTSYCRSVDQTRLFALSNIVHHASCAKATQRGPGVRSISASRLPRKRTEEECKPSSAQRTLCPSLELLLKAIPYFVRFTLKKLLPYVKRNSDKNFPSFIKSQWRAVWRRPKGKCCCKYAEFRTAVQSGQ